MARPHIPEAAPAYYPPRARWYAPFFYLGNALHRRVARERLTLSRTMQISELVAGFFVPGLSVWLRGPKFWGRAALAGSLVLAAIIIVWLGYPVANLAFGLLISLHCTGFVYYCQPLMAGEPFRGRLAFTFLMLLAISLLLYLPARNLIQEHGVTPLRLHGRVVVVQRNFPAHRIQRGDWVAYHLNADALGENYHDGVMLLHGGLSFEPVLARAGDRVIFSTNSFSVNGIEHTNRPHMPQTGELTVPEKHWFIWPNLDISGHGDVGEARVSSALLGLADVAETSFYGKPLPRWFGRKQIFP